LFVTRACPDGHIKVVLHRIRQSDCVLEHAQILERNECPGSSAIDAEHARSSGGWFDADGLAARRGLAQDARVYAIHIWILVAPGVEDAHARLTNGVDAPEQGVLGSTAETDQAGFLRLDPLPLVPGASHGSAVQGGRRSERQVLVELRRHLPLEEFYECGRGHATAGLGRRMLERSEAGLSEERAEDVYGMECCVSRLAPMHRKCCKLTMGACWVLV
jgi:hypothetical protein